MSLALSPVAADDFEDLLVLRVAALQPSLERIGRFDPERARARFAGQFEPRWMRWIESDAARIGLLTLRREGERFWHLDHLYVDPAAQGKGAGAWALQQAQAEAAAAGFGIELEALQHSDANRFYRRLGFQLVAEDGIDCRYRWEPIA
jgi:GNAT superfamily N-acetyltransferase